MLEGAPVRLAVLVHAVLGVDPVLALPGPVDLLLVVDLGERAPPVAHTVVRGRADLGRVPVRLAAVGPVDLPPALRLGRAARALRVGQRPAGVLGVGADRPATHLTTFDLDEYVYGALRAGACGFLLKDSGPERLLAAVAAVAGGDALFAPSVTRRLVEAYARHSAREQPTDLQALTSRELEVLKLIARGLSNPEIADLLYISEATVKTHLNRTMTKLDLDSRAQAVVVAYESGLVTPGG
ncbi:LuxR C-terminal-related transcriptional regulator [Streptomyces sp. M41]|uniref:LuxR C-terminal-related transcriptional regulator n=1 Tax=Streptomyces sp. M41 TaxID=3059412 RepID=UPI00374CE1D4